MLRFRYTWPAAILAGVWSGWGWATFTDKWMAARDLSANEASVAKFLIAVAFLLVPVMLLVWKPRWRRQAVTMDEAMKGPYLWEFAKSGARGLCWFAASVATAETILRL